MQRYAEYTDFSINMNACCNKAGYTANTSHGRVGRGGNASFPTFRLVLTNGPTDKASYRVACPRLKSDENQETQSIEIVKNSLNFEHAECGLNLFASARFTHI